MNFSGIIAANVSASPSHRSSILTWITCISLLASSAESVGGFWFREASQVVIESNFHSVIGAEAVGSSGDQSDFVVEALNGTIGDFSFGPKPVQDQRLMCAQHPGYLFHRFQTAAHGPEAPVVEKAAGPDYGLVLPKIGEGFLQIPGPCGSQLAGQQDIEFLPSPPAHPTAAAEKWPPHMLKTLGERATAYA